MRFREGVRTLVTWYKGNEGHPWDKGFGPEAYGSENYYEISDLDREILTDLDTFYTKEIPMGKALSVGTGSNLYPILALLAYVDEIDLTDFSENNLQYLNQQKNNLDPRWDLWIAELRRLNPERYENFDFQKAFREKVTVKKADILSDDFPKQEYDHISMHSVAESISSRGSHFRKAVKNFLQAGKPGATVDAVFVSNSAGYSSPGRRFPAYAIDGRDPIAQMSFLMSLNFSLKETDVDLRDGEPLIRVTGRLNREPLQRRALSGKRYRLN